MWDYLLISPPEYLFLSGNPIPFTPLEFLTGFIPFPLRRALPQKDCIHVTLSVATCSPSLWDYDLPSLKLSPTKELVRRAGRFARNDKETLFSLHPKSHLLRLIADLGLASVALFLKEVLEWQ